MAVCIFESPGVLNLEPLTLTRPAFELWCGTTVLLERQRWALDAKEVGVVVRPMLAELCQQTHPELAVNDADWLRRQPRVLVDSRWLPPPSHLTDLSTPRVGCIGEDVVFAVLPTAGLADLSFDNIEAVLAGLKQSLPRCEAGGVLMRYAWDLVEHNPQAIRDDAQRTSRQGQADNRIALVGRTDQLFVDPTATIEPYVLADTRQGPVIIERGATVQSFTRLEGPCYVGSESVLLGAKFRGGSLGPKCRVGGEFEASIIQGYSNKYHDGFLGHSYICEWVNLAAGTQTSDLRNDYGEILVTVHGARTPTGSNKVGCFLGDHTKTGLNTLLNCGAVAGVFCNLLPTDSYLPTAIPSFTLCRAKMWEQSNLAKLFETAALAMRRRGCELTEAHRRLYTSLFDLTSGSRGMVHK